MAVSKYALLLRLATEKEEAAADRMREAQMQLDVARSKLEQLDGFRNEYRQRLQARGGQGMNVTLWVDFQRFLGRLDEAMKTQEADVDRCNQRFLMARYDWQEQRKSVKAFEKLMEREAERALKKELRREQKLTDEFAARKFRERQAGED